MISLVVGSYQVAYFTIRNGWCRETAPVASYETSPTRPLGDDSDNGRFGVRCSNDGVNL